ncbi:MAG: hypothetical protein JNK27_00015 [Chitinophagaceae bacterium]|nr:hypothetical protein [Chitinophagaceae bacterium]
MKGPIFHKILYKLSRKQQQKFQGEQDWFEEIEAFQSEVDAVFFCCGGGCGRKIQVRTHATPEAMKAFGQDPNKLTAYCSHCNQQTEFRAIIRHQPKRTEEIVEIQSTTKRNDLEIRANEILSELRDLSVEDTFTQDGRYYSEKVSQLFDELKGVLDQLASKQWAHLKKLYAGLRRPIILDLRKRYRCVSAFLFKNLSDFSGCEDEASLTEPSVKQTNSFSKIKKLCVTIQSCCFPRLIPLSNLRMTG